MSDLQYTYPNFDSVDPRDPERAVRDLVALLQEFQAQVVDAIKSATAVLNISASSDDLDVTGYGTVSITTTGGNVTIGGLSGGYEGKRVIIHKRVIANSLIIEHNEGSGEQKIFLADASDLTLANYGGVDLVFSNTLWYEVGRE
jgi:hypothetical protein